VSLRHYISAQVEKLASPEAHEAIANLLALSPLAIPNLIEQFWSARNPDIRSTVVFVIAQFADESAMEFFIEAMDDVHEQTWMNALDGLVNIGSAAAIKRLTRFMVTLNPDDIRGAWTMEAIEQIAGSAG
jgi:HEAT repeat protein